MPIDITRLKSNIDEYIVIDEAIQLDETYKNNSELIDLKNTKVKGKIYKDATDEITLELFVEGIMVLPCAITLKPVDYPFSFEVSGNVQELYEEIDKNDKKTENSIDILPIIWENILMEMPMRVVSEDLSDAKVSGEGWRIITEEEKTYINPELEKLKDLLK